MVVWVVSCEFCWVLWVLLVLLWLYVCAGVGWSGLGVLVLICCYFCLCCVADFLLVVGFPYCCYVV